MGLLKELQLEGELLPLDRLEIGDWVYHERPNRDESENARRMITPMHSAAYYQGFGAVVGTIPVGRLPAYAAMGWKRIPAARWPGFDKARFAKWMRPIIQVNCPQVQLGCDPELFVLGANDKLVPAWEFLPDKSQDSIYWDGAQAEFRVEKRREDLSKVEGFGCQDYLTHQVLAQLSRLKSLSPANTRLSALSSVRLSSEQLASAKDEWLAFGCQASENAYGLRGLQIDDPRGMPYRFAGGHMHFGLFEKDRPLDRIIEAVKMLDAVLGVCSVAFTPREDPIRREYYGLAGEYRLPKHGVEWRTPSNFWLRAPQLVYYAFSTARKAFQLGWQGFRSQYDASDEEVVNCINRHDVELAKQLMERNRPLLEGIWSHAFFSKASGLNTYSRTLAGIDACFPDDLERNWFNYSKEILDNAARWGAYA